MSELGETFRDYNEYKKQKHRQWHEENTRILDEIGVDYKAASDECYLIRTDSVKVDFYPSTGRWRDVKTGKMYRGGAKRLIGWMY